MKKSIIIGMAFLVYLFISLPTVHADSGQLYKVDSDRLELMDAPGPNATVLAELTSGAEVTIFQELYDWGKTFYNGKEAWVDLYQITAVNDTQEEQADTEQPETTEQQVEPSESSEIDTESSESLESANLYEVKQPSVRLRTAPNENATIITELNKGAEVSVFQESNGWGKTYYNGNEVWIALYLLEETSTDGTVSEVNEEAVLQQTTEDIKKDEEIEEELVEKEESASEAAQKDEEMEEEHVEKEKSEAEPVPREEEIEEEPVEKEESESEAVQKDEEKEEELVEKGESAIETGDKQESHNDQGKQTGEKALSGYHFVIDPGHGGKDPGAVRSDVYEKTLTLSTAKKVEEQLRDKGASVTLTRKDDTFIPLEQRVQISNSNNTDAFISLHYNAFKDQSAHGIHTFYYAGGENQKFADAIQKSLINHVNLRDRGEKHADFRVLRDNKQLALLLELGFISNPEERELVRTEEYREKVATGIVAGLEGYFIKN